jgi:sigma-54 dependent transcriptional regulator, acetoin dehydrogenase operon transcriptional activator AcoR
MARKLPLHIHPLLRRLMELAPSIRSLISLDIGITVTDRETQLYYLPGRKGRLTIEPGDPVLPDSVSMTSMLEDRLVVKMMERRLGHDYLGRAVPVKDETGGIIGSFGTVEVVTHQSILEGMVIGKSGLFLEAYNQAVKAAKYDTSVMIIGETGTGKELIARLIVEESRRRDLSFIVVNCASVPPTLFESEMFGYDEGSFTGAKKGGKQGYFEMAQNGTIFLDEIGELDLSLQAKLLRVLETGRLSRVGGHKEITVTPRIITATNKDLPTAVLQQKFRADLFFRLSSIIITLPPLRERKEDIRLYIDRILEREKTKFGKDDIVLLPDAYLLLESYDYPGNIRELENILRRAVILCDGGQAGSHDIEAQLLSNATDKRHSTASQVPQELNTGRAGETWASALVSMEKEAISRALALSPKKSHAAKSLGISRDTLYRKIRKYNLV